jgi:hypothetical protein
MVVMSVRRFVLTMLVSLCSLATGALLAAPSALAEEACPNASLRTGFSAYLPDCRAYEMVSPADMNGYEVTPWDESQAAPNGEAVHYVSQAGAFGDSASGEAKGEFLSDRTLSGWVTHALTPPEDGSALQDIYSVPEEAGFSIDLTKEVLLKKGGPSLAPGAPEGYDNLYLRNSLTGSYELITLVKPPNLTPTQYNYDSLHFDGASPSDNTVVFNVGDALTPEALPKESNVYAWREGKLMLVSVLPDGQAATTCGVLEPPGQSPFSGGGGGGTRRMISSDGLLVLWERELYEQSGLECGGGRAFYETDLATGKSVEISAPQGVTSAPGEGRLDNASSDGMKSYFMDSAPLTADAGTGGVDPNGDNTGDLYEYDLETHSLTDLTPAADGEAAKVYNATYVSEDGSYVYFGAEGAIASTPNARGETPTAGKPNLYVWHDGSIAFIATLGSFGSGEGEVLGGTVGKSDGSFEGTPDGTHFVFMSTLPLTGYDNTDAITGAADEEFFLYDAVTGALTCVSCNPSGARPVGSAKVPYISGRRIMSSDGSRVAFESTDVLAAFATDGASNVYEWENGHIYLISTGRQGARLSSMGSSGNDIFFFTTQQLVAQDVAVGNTNIYDARVDGGFSPPSSVPPCSEEGCKPPLSPAPAVFGVPPSATFSGIGNAATSTVVSQSKPKHAVVRKRKRRLKDKSGAGKSTAGRAGAHGRHSRASRFAPRTKR